MVYLFFFPNPENSLLMFVLAFKLSPRELDSYEISKTVDSDDDAEDGTVTQEVRLSLFYPLKHREKLTDE